MNDLYDTPVTGVRLMRLLVVEDEKKLADFLVRGLRSDGFATDVAYDGTMGWGMASATDYDVSILDLSLPGVGGTDLLKRLRLRGSSAAVRGLTARDAT